MARIRLILEALSRPEWLPLYLAGLTLMLGWSSNRGYLRYFGISPTGLGRTSEETYINYFGYGLRAYTERCVALSFFLALVLICIWLVLPELIRRIWPPKPTGWHAQTQNLWTLVSLAILILGVPLSFLGANYLGWRAGEARAKAEYEKLEPNAFWPVSWRKIEGNQLPPETGGCWRQVLQDKQNLYLFWSPVRDPHRPRRQVFIVPIDKFEGLALQEPGDCATGPYPPPSSPAAGSTANPVGK